MQFKPLLGFIGVVFLLISAPKNSIAELVTYHIGNSLTGNLIVPNRLPELAASGIQEPWTVGYQIRPGNSLTTMHATPVQAGDIITAPGSWPQHFASVQYDALVLQPFNGPTIRQEVQAAQQFISDFRGNSTNANSRVLIYAIWASNTVAAPFQTTWNRQDFTLDSPFVPSALTYSLFMQELRIAVPNAELIPAGHVFNAVLDRVNSPGGLPGLTNANQLIGDTIHATNAGGYLAGLAAYSVLYGASPIGLEYTAGYSNPNFGYVLPSTAVPIVQEIARDVLSAVPEPNSVFMVILAMGSYSGWIRRRRYA